MPRCSLHNFSYIIEDLFSDSITGISCNPFPFLLTHISIFGVLCVFVPYISNIFREFIADLTFYCVLTSSIARNL